MTDARRSLWRRLGDTPGARGALVLVLLLLALALVAPLLVATDAATMGDLVREKLQPPSPAHPFGTDPFARDVLTRMLFGARVSLGIAVLAVVLSTTLGTLVGAATAVAPPWVDELGMRLVDAAMAIPRVLLVVAVVALWGARSTTALVLLLGGTGWFALARLVRTEVRALVARDFVAAAAALGVTRRRRITHHVIPHLVPLLLTHATLAVATVIAVEAALSYLGLGVQPPTPSWGNIMLEANGQIGQAWWLILFPALATIATVAALQLLGDGLRSAFSDGQLGPVPPTPPAR
jgi:peptide/nickel transport system permease protein